MALLEQLPLELLHEVADYLVFIDRKALAAVSKQMSTCLRPITCPDQLSWIVHCCRFPSIEADNPILLHPEPVLEHLKRMRRELNHFKHWSLNYPNGWFDINYGEELPGKSLLMPYFRDLFPNSTLACLYFRTIHVFAKSAISLSGGKTRSRSAYGKSTTTWRQIERESGWSFTWLNRRRPDPRYLI